MANNNKIKELEVLRAIAFIFVVGQHPMGGYSNANGINYFSYSVFKLFFTLAKPAVQIFICLSAITLFYVYSKKFDLKNYYKKGLIKIFMPYMIWSIFFIIIHKRFSDIKNLIGILITGDSYYHLWYMGMTIRIYIFIPLILLFFKFIHKKGLKLSLVVFVILFLFYYEISAHQSIIANTITDFLFKNPTHLQEKFISVSPLFWYLYFIIGVYIALNYENFKNIVLKFKLLVFLIFFFLFVYTYLNEINKVQYSHLFYILYSIFSILNWYVIAVQLTNTKSYDFFRFISKCSFAGYLSHVFIAEEVVNTITYYLHLKNLLLIGFSTWILTVIITPIVVIIISCMPYSQILTGIEQQVMPWKFKHIIIYKNQKRKQL